MSHDLSSPDLTREGVRLLVAEMGVARAMRFLGDWSQRNRATSQSRSEYLPEREQQFGALTVDEICREIEAWKRERSPDQANQSQGSDDSR